ncbi:MAG TPA: polysaccharide deacetylase family protein [Mycobacteriales bacterium]|nr:polysaccharide deacetylase family protein [Mycobacteriales bacterium]
MTRRRKLAAAAAVSTYLLVGLVAVPAAADDARAAFALPRVVLNTCPATTAVVRSRAPGTGKTVALTFDDGPGRSTSSMLTILQRNGIRATFFNIGAQLATRVSLLQREVRLGAAIGNHTWDHPEMPTLTATAQAREIDRTTAAIERLAGVRPCLFRPPYGEYTATTLRLATARHLGFWTWSVDPEDWKAEGSASTYWVRRIVSRAKAGLSQLHPVILLHNGTLGNPATVAALPQIIRAYRSAGYRFVRLH